MTVREFDDIKNGSVVSLADNTNDNLVVKVSGTNVIMFCGKESFVIGSTETETDKTLVESINTMLRVYLRSQYDWEHITEYDWGYQFEENVEMTEKERRELIISWLLDIVKDTNLFDTYEHYCETSRFCVELSFLCEEAFEIGYFTTNDYDDEYDTIRISDSFGNELDFDFYVNKGFDAFKNGVIDTLTSVAQDTVKDKIYYIING